MPGTEAAAGPAPRVDLYAAAHKGLCHQTADSLLTVARDCLDAAGWVRLARALGLPPVPGLVTV